MLRDRAARGPVPRRASRRRRSRRCACPSTRGRRRASVDIRVSPARRDRARVPAGRVRMRASRRRSRPAQRPTPPERPSRRRAISSASSSELKAHLRDTVEQYEASTEELKASNEELQAMNEELRSATEELETSREELQSINEELTTVNHELKGKVDELAHANTDLQNLMAATAIATVFLDRELRITRYTPPRGRAVQPHPGRRRPAARRPDAPARLPAADRTTPSRCSSTLVPIEREVRAGDALVPGPRCCRTAPPRTASPASSSPSSTSPSAQAAPRKPCASPSSSSGRWSARRRRASCTSTWRAHHADQSPLRRIHRLWRRGAARTTPA